MLQLKNIMAKIKFSVLNIIPGIHNLYDTKPEKSDTIMSKELNEGIILCLRE